MSQATLNVTPQSTTTPTKSPDKKKSDLTFTFTPSADNVNLNLLILLHGLGKSPFYCLCTVFNIDQRSDLAFIPPIHYCTGVYLTGDTEEPYNKLGINLKLPQTATMAVQAPEPVPYMDEGYQWFPSFDLLTGESKWKHPRFSPE